MNSAIASRVEVRVIMTSPASSAPAHEHVSTDRRAAIVERRPWDVADKPRERWCLLFLVAETIGANSDSHQRVA